MPEKNGLSVKTIKKLWAFYSNKYLSDFFIGYKSVLGTFIITITLYGLCFTSIKVPIIFSISESFAVNLIQQNLSVIIGLFSIIIAMVLILFSLFQSSKGGKELLNIIVVETRIYPILWLYVWFSIALIVLIFIGGDSSLIPPQIYIKIAVLSGYFFIFLLLSIGYLFHRILRLLATDFYLKIYIEKLKDLLELEKDYGPTQLMFNIKNRLFSRFSKAIEDEKTSDIKSLIDAFGAYAEINPNSRFFGEINSGLMNLLNSAKNQNNFLLVKKLLSLWGMLIRQSIDQTTQLTTKIREFPAFVYSQFSEEGDRKSVSGECFSQINETFEMLVNQFDPERDNYDALCLNRCFDEILWIYNRYFFELWRKSDNQEIGNYFETLGKFRGEFLLPDEFYTKYYHLKELFKDDRKNDNTYKNLEKFVYEIEYPITAINLTIIGNLSWILQGYFKNVVTIDEIKSILSRFHSIRMQTGEILKAMNLFHQNEFNIYEWENWSWKSIDNNKRRFGFHLTSTPYIWVPLSISIFLAVEGNLEKDVFLFQAKPEVMGSHKDRIIDISDHMIKEDDKWFSAAVLISPELNQDTFIQNLQDIKEVFSRVTPQHRN